MKRRPIATRYAALVVLLLSLALIAGGALETWVSHRERQAGVEALQREKAQAAAAAVSRFVEDVLRSLDWVTLTAAPTTHDELERRRLDFLKLLHLEPAITTAFLVDREGRERLRVSRIKTDRIASGIDLSLEPGFAEARAGRAHFSDVFFLAQTEPYLTIAAPSAARDGSVVMADVNLKFVRTVVSQIKVGKTGYAYVVDAQGRLVSHPDLSLVLQMTDLSRLPQVKAAHEPGSTLQGFADDGRDLAGAAVLAAHAKVAPLNWTVFVEQARAEALAPLIASIARSAMILLVALVLAAVAGVVAARRMVAPIGELRRGALRFGSGDLAHRIEVASGDELEDLAAQFNAMGEQLRETYATLERKVAERTHELNQRNAQVSEALEQQTATAEILRAISASPTDVKTVFETIVHHTARLCDAQFAAVFLVDGQRLYAAAQTKSTPDYAANLERGFPIDRRTTAGRAALGRTPVQITDILSDPEFEIMPAHRAEGVRTVLAVPLLRDETLVGVLTTWWREVRPFSDKQVKLLQTFADQAVIAIENHRMFDEIQQKGRQLEIADRAKSLFLAAASHDLRQPMHALSLFVGQLRASPTRAERLALTQRIEEAVGSLSELLDQLLDLSRLESGAVQAVQEDFAIQEVLSSIEAEFGPLAREKGIGLRVVPSHAWLCSDPMLVRRILLNLVANAIRYTDRGGVLVGCRVRGRRLRIGVWDTGCGIPDDRRDDVFHEFVQLRSARQPRDRLGQGLGLGLAIVARLADLLGAHVELRSNLGSGSMFTFELPLGRPSAAPQRAAEPFSFAGLRGVLVLVIDDDESARVGMCGLLKSWGCLTLAARDGSEAIAQLREHDRPPELIVCDYQLDERENGLQAIARVRVAVGEAVSAILVTADTSKAVLDAAQAARVPLLHKPVSPIRLRALMARLLPATQLHERA